MKKLMVVLCMALIAMVWGKVQAEDVYDKKLSMKSVEAEKLLQEIMQQQNVTDKEKLDCSKISDRQLEDLGGFYLKSMFGDEKDLVLITRLLGGEGSQLMIAAKRIIGAKHLGCINDMDMGMGMMKGKMKESGMKDMHKMCCMQEKKVMIAPDGSIIVFHDGMLMKYDKDLVLKKTIDIYESHEKSDKIIKKDQGVKDSKEKK